MSIKNSNSTASHIRSTFIDYFAKNGHVHVPSSPLIPHHDPSLMFVNSGMVQFKNVFTGLEKRDYKTATTSQKCVRAGGKHNDLDNVGYTARHHTFFEMLGNFSFGDYFKEQAIYYAWELLTKELGLDKNKLYATVYHTDEEAVSYWKKISGFSDDRIIRINTNDNFWSMGDTGPCGPCSEIFYDHGDSVFGGLPGTKDQDGDRYVEIWNMVFMQFEQVDKDTRVDLPQQSIDTGSGLERVAAVMQGVHNNFEIDLFREIIQTSEELTGRKSENEAKFSHRVIADHLRSMAFLVADGVMPSNEGRGYVLRRIMRRAMRHAHQLGAKEPLMYKLLPKLVELMGSAYPELKRAEAFVSDILKQEEERFKSTLERGLKLLHEEITHIPSGSSLSGDIAFKLYDTYGFPLDLTEDILKSKNIGVDNAGFIANMEAQKEVARKSWSGSGAAQSDKVWFELKEKFGSTEFLGYSMNAAEGTVLAVISDRDTNSDESNTVTIVTNQTPFYGESGGQMGDIGEISKTNFKARVIDTKKYLGIHAHVCKVEQGSIKEGEIVTLTIDEKYRDNLRAHHSATHILHAALRSVLGVHISQKGSLVAHDKLRFDISHPKSIDRATLNLVEDIVNAEIRNNSEVSTKLMSTEDAISAGAMALFGEKYDSEVRVISMHNSMELCGGTHVKRTGGIGSFKILSESAIAAGVRRIEAVCGAFADNFAKNNEELLSQISGHIKSSKHDILPKLEKLLQSQKDLEKEVMNLKVKQLSFNEERIAKESLVVSSYKLLYKELHVFDAKAMRNAAEEATKKFDNLIVVFINQSEDKLGVVVSVSQDIASNVPAFTLAKHVASVLGGTGGGGSNTLAQAGGTDISKLPEMVQELTNFLTHN
ncbi:MAG: alanine--tRNA ligase [Pseudomonadota bacterium]